jgi:hypothetical protein
MCRLRQSIFAVFAGCIALPAVAHGATFSIELQPTVTTGAYGNYLAAPFDFGTAFSQIESFKLEFVSATGYDGGIGSTGNSTFSKLLKVAAHEGDAPLTSPPNVLDLDSVGFSQTYFHVPANTPTEARFGPLTFSIGTENPEIIWPDFSLAGRGWISMIDEASGWYHPLPEGITLSSSLGWKVPEIASARLTIVGTVVPEPSAVVLFCCGLAAFGLLPLRA